MDGKMMPVEKFGNIRTMCEECAALYRLSYSVKEITMKTTTEKKKKCEHCGRNKYGMKQYDITRKEGLV